MSRWAELVARALHTVSIGRITVVTDTGVIQTLQTQERPGADGTLGVTDQVLRVAQFGFTSSPPLGSDVVLLRLWGNRTLTIGIGTNHKTSRLKNLQAGDSALYDVRGAYAWFTAEGLVIDAAGLAVKIQNFSSCTVEGNLQVTGDVVAGFGGSEVSLLTHVHPLSGGPTTGAPLPEGTGL